MENDWLTSGELDIFVRGATNANITKSEGKGAKFYIKYQAQSTEEPGKTRVDWELYKGGRDDTEEHPSFSWSLNLYITSDQKITYDREGVADGLVYKQSRVNTNVNTSQGGNNHPHVNFRFKYNTTPTKSGYFIITHDSNGLGNFKIKAEASIYTYTMSSGSEKAIELPTNYPQTPCYWASGAEVKIEQPYVAPNGEFTISWSGAMPGIDNEIAGYNVYYKVGTDDFTRINSDEAAEKDSSLTVQLPSDAPRGASITAKVEIIGEKIKTPVEKTSGSSMVNPKLGNLQIIAYTGQETGKTFSYKAPDIEFTYILPTKATPQQIESKVKIDNGDETTLQDNPYVYDLTNSTWDYGETKTFVFWATDGVEDSDEVEISLTRNVNIENQVSYGIEGYGFKIVMPDGYTAKLKTSQSVTLTNDVEIDFRSLCTNLQSGQTFEQTAYLEYTDGGPDTVTEEIVLAGEVPAFTMSGTVQELKQYFVGNNFETLAIDISSDQWSYSGIKEVEPGRTLEQVKMKGSIGNEFYVAVGQDNIVTAIKNLNLNLKLEGGEPYKPYSGTPIFSSAIESNNWGQYGLNRAPTLTFWFEGSSENASASSLGASSDNTIEYQLAGEAVYNIVPSDFDTGDEGRLSYSYTNVYGTEITQTSEDLFEFDFREQAKQADSTSSWNICAIPPGKNWDTKYAIENWDCIKENMPLSTNFEVAATTQPIAWLERKINNNWQKFYDFNVIETGNKDEKVFNAPVSTYELQSVAKVGKITDGTAGPIRLVIKTDSPNNLVVEYVNKSSFSFAYHVPPLIKFTDVSYEAPQSGSGSGKITAKYEILSLGSNSSKISKKYGCKVEGAAEVLESVPGSVEEDKASFLYTINGTFVNIAPILITTLSATITINGVVESAFEKEYSTLEKDYEYIVCYNISPTVAYRANHLGINTNAPVENALLDINAHNNHQLIYLRGASHLSTIDLTTGALINFILDAGSWDGTPGGIIPSNPEVPTGLAAIAYTGEFGDLLQRREDVIIISGGTSEI